MKELTAGQRRLRNWRKKRDRIKAGKQIQHGKMPRKLLPGERRIITGKGRVIIKKVKRRRLGSGLKGKQFEGIRQKKIEIHIRRLELQGIEIERIKGEILDEFR